MRAQSPQAVTFADFAAFVIAAAFVVAVFVAPYIMAWHYLDSHFSRMAEHDSRPRPSTYHPTTQSTPRKAGATFPPRASYLLLGALAPLEIPDKMPAGDSSDGVRRLSGSQDAIDAGRGLKTLANSAAHVCGIDPALFWSLIQRESSGRHWDAEGRVLRSSSNALGLGQIKASTARGVSPHLDPLKPWDNAVASACHLRSLLDANRGNVRKALHDYHAGAYRKRTSAETLAYAADIIQGSAQ